MSILLINYSKSSLLAYDTRVDEARFKTELKQTRYKTLQYYIRGLKIVSLVAQLAIAKYTGLPNAAAHLMLDLGLLVLRLHPMPSFVGVFEYTQCFDILRLRTEAWSKFECVSFLYFAVSSHTKAECSVRPFNLYIIDR